MSKVETERLVLRPPSPEDVDALHAIFAKPEVWWYPHKRGFDRDETARWIERHTAGWSERGFGLWLASLKATGQLIGYCGLSVPTFLPEILPAVEVGYRLDPDSWGHGYATEGARAALRFAFEERAMDEVFAIYEPENDRSGRVMQRIGMTFDRDTVVPDEGLPVRVMRITRERWLTSPR